MMWATTTRGGNAEHAQTDLLPNLRTQARPLRRLVSHRVDQAQERRDHPGRRVPGFRKTVRRGRPTERVVYRVRRADGSAEDLLDHMAPTLFRPAYLDRYPNLLPPPAALIHDVDWPSEHPARGPRKAGQVRTRGRLSRRSRNRRCGSERPRSKVVVTKDQPGLELMTGQAPKHLQSRQAP